MLTDLSESCPHRTARGVLHGALIRRLRRASSGNAATGSWNPVLQAGFFLFRRFSARSLSSPSAAQALQIDWKGAGYAQLHIDHPQAIDTDDSVWRELVPGLLHLSDQGYAVWRRDGRKAAAAVGRTRMAMNLALCPYPDETAGMRLSTKRSMMRTLLSIAALSLALGVGSAAQAQSCGSGGGATVCLTANGTPDNIQLNWTVSGAVTGLQVYRDTDANPAGRSRLATLSASSTAYTDANAAGNTPYWYWVRFTTRAGSYNSGAATAVRNPACAQATVSPWISVNGAWTHTASATASAGSQVVLGPQASETGSWSWSGCGTAGSAREQAITATANCTATATFTRSCGTKTIQPFTIAVPGLMRELTSVQLSKLMSPGINLGNTLEAIPNEQSWNPTLTTQATLNGFKAAGFKSVRIPVAWSQYADADHNISPAWMARVKQVVDYARTAGLYAMVNIHWDGGWLNHTTYAAQPANNAKLIKFWTQIADTFKNYDDYLLFAGTNEVGMDNVPWGTPIAAEWADVQNGYNQAFVNAVRATGGNNAKRHLVVQTYFTDINNAMAVNTVPTDTVANRLFMEAHYYDPFNFTINGGSTVWQWGANATDPAATETWANEAWVDAQFQKMKTRYVDQGVGVIIGEYGAYVKPAYPGMAAYRRYWAEYITRSIVQHGQVPMWWDTGELIDRATGAQKVPDLISTLVDASK